MWSAIWAIAYKEYLQVIRGGGMPLRRLLTIQIVNFVMLAWMNVTIRDVPTVMVDHDQSSESRDLAARLEATHTFKFEYQTTSEDQAREHIQSGRAKVAIVIPPDYSRLRASGQPSRILAIVDGSDAPSSQQALTAVDGVTARINLETQLDGQDDAIDQMPSVTPHSVLLFNPAGRTSSFLLPGLFAISLAVGYSRIVMRGIVMEREGGTLDRLLMTPLNSTGLIIGKMIPYFVVGWLNAIGYLILMRWGFGVPIRGSIPLLVIGTTLYVVLVLAVGVFVAAGSRHMGEANAMWNFFTLPAMMLSGYIFPLSAVPLLARPISYAIPQTHFIEFMRGICLRGADARELLLPIVYLVITPVVIIIAAAIRFSRSIVPQ